jgi:ATP-binding cassette, subfamily B, bacterial IrtB/YbtQ
MEPLRASAGLAVDGRSDVMATENGITSLRVTWQQLMRAARSRASGLRLSLIGLGLAAVLQGLAFACIMPVFSLLMIGEGWRNILPWLLAMTALMIASSVVRWIAQGFDYNGEMVRNTHELRSELGFQLRNIPLLTLQEKRAGEVNATLLGNVDENLTYVLTIGNQIATAIITPFVVAIATMFFDWRMGLLLLLVFPVLIPLYRWRRPAFGRGMRALADATEQASAEMLEYAQGLQVLRTAGAVGERAERLNASIKHLENVQAYGQRKGTKPNLIIATAMEIGLLLVVALGAWLVTDNLLQIGLLAAITIVVVRFAEPLSTIILMTLTIDLMETALGKIEALLDIKPLPQNLATQIPMNNQIEFDRVSFGYGGDSGPPVLNNITLNFPERSLTALVGSSGSGKTTITRLIMRQADAETGSVKIGGVDVKVIEPDCLNQLISVVFQDVYLFDDTILNNIRMARPEASDEEVEAAARSAHCHEFISRLPQGYQTPIGALGGRLSGGERQRISIARAMLKNAPIVILDEPTAALDTESEVAVQSAIDALVRERTVIIIAHRLSTITGADNIIVLEDGEMKEQGTQEKLTSIAGRYASMWNTQNASISWNI